VHIALTNTTDDFVLKFSKLNRLLHVTAYCMRFINNGRQQLSNRVSTPLTPREVHQAFMCCIKSVQRSSYTKQLHDLVEQQEVAKTSNLKLLYPVIDKRNLTYKRKTATIRPSIPNNASDHSTSQSSLNETACVLRTHTFTSRWLPTTKHIPKKYLLDP
jgi:hypothetical protein